MFGDTFNMSCILCSAKMKGCLECTNATYCSKCDSASNYYIEYDFKSCTKECGLGYYPNNFTYQCTACPKGCTKCTGPLYTNCTICNGDYFFDPVEPAQCSLTCQNGYYGNTTTNKCEPCIICNTCSLTATNCTSCQGEHQLETEEIIPARYLQNWTCVDVLGCFNGSYPNATTLKCEACHPYC